MGELTAWDVLKWVGGPVLGLGALTAWWCRDFLKAYLPWLDPTRVGRRAQQRDLPLPKGERFVVLIADLQGDDEQKSHTRHVAAALEPYKGLDVVRIGPGPEWDIGARDEFEAAARNLLADRRGDLLISGDVATKDKALRLRILPADPGLRPELATAEGRRPGEYALTETGLPLDFDKNFNAVLVALVVAAVAPATKQQGQYVAHVLEPAAGRLKHLCAHMPAGLDPDQRGSLWHALGLASAVLGHQSEETVWLEEAVAAFRRALREWPREREPLRWAGAQNNLGWALRTFGKRERSPARLDQAVKSFELTAEVFTEQQCSALWANAQANLGDTLLALAERHGEVEHFERALTAYGRAATVYTREAAPFEWAWVQTGLGNALLMIGERKSDRSAIQEAILVLQASLEIRKRQLVPMEWAETTGNLGAAYLRLGILTGEIEHLQIAAKNFQDTTLEFTEERHPLEWATAQNNAGVTFFRLAWHEFGAGHVDEAIAACRSAIIAYYRALRVRTTDRAPLDWAATQNNLGSATLTLAEWETDTARLEEAVAAYRAALEVFRQAGATYYISVTEQNLARAEALLAERRGGAAAE